MVRDLVQGDARFLGRRQPSTDSGFYGVYLGVIHASLHGTHPAPFPATQHPLKMGMEIPPRTHFTWREDGYKATPEKQTRLQGTWDQHWPRSWTRRTQPVCQGNAINCGINRWDHRGQSLGHKAWRYWSQISWAIQPHIIHVFTDSRRSEST